MQNDCGNSQALAVVVYKDLPVVRSVFHRPAELVVVVRPVDFAQALLLVELAELIFPCQTVLRPVRSKRA